MDKHELAAQLDKIQYPVIIDNKLLVAAEAADLVVMYGASDDLMELQGAINDEAGMYNGGTIIIDRKGVLPNSESLMDDSPTKAQVREYFEREKESTTIKAVWDSEGYSFIYKTRIPHATFEVMEDEEKYCRGIVFSLSDISQAVAQAA